MAYSVLDPSKYPGFGTNISYWASTAKRSTKVQMF